MADPVTVITHSTGTTRPDDTIMNAFGMHSVPATPELPYELTLTSTFDPKDTWAYNYGYNYGGDVVVEFKIGDQVYHYEGGANSTVDRTSVSSLDSYEHHIWFDTNSVPSTGFTVHFYNALYYLPGGPGQEGPLTPFDADETSSKDVFGHSSVVMYPANPDIPLRWSMDGNVATVSVHVAVVPEPTHIALLGAGLLTLVLRRRLGYLRI
jgi:uncharacterized protein YodC (DUF2158 family)